MRTVVVSEFLQQKSLARLQASFDVVYDPDLYADRPRLLESVTGAEAIVIRNRTRLDSEVLDAAPTLKMVGRLGVGLDNIDMEACSKAGVEVVPAVGANAVSVAEYVIAAMLLLTRRVFGMTESMVAGEWPRQGHAFGRELMGTTLGLVGYGSIAREVAARAVAFGVSVAAYDPYLEPEDPAWGNVRRVEFEELLEQADTVSLHVPLNDNTKNLFDSTALQKMKPGSILINTSRGGTVDQEALALALRDGQIGGAAIDVFAVEPLQPEPAALFTGVENLILTPHLAGNTSESVDRVAEMITDAVLERLAD